MNSLITVGQKKEGKTEERGHKAETCLSCPLTGFIALEADCKRLPDEGLSSFILMLTRQVYSAVPVQRRKLSFSQFTRFGFFKAS